MTIDETILTVATSGARLTLESPDLVIAGYTGRDRAAVEAHIDELAAIGVEPPPQVPMYYRLDAALLTTSPDVLVNGERTSGEVEPIVVWSGGRRYLGVGSDHTDRQTETESVAASKAAAPKPIGPEVVPLDDVLDRWDEIRVSCHVDGRGYQDGTLAAMLPLKAVVAGLAKEDDPPTGDVVMFCGTVPLLDGGFVFGREWEMELRLPDGRALALGYTVTAAV